MHRSLLKQSKSSSKMSSKFFLFCWAAASAPRGIGDPFLIFFGFLVYQVAGVKGCKRCLEQKVFGVNVLFGTLVLSSDAAQLGLSSKTLYPKNCVASMSFKNAL